MEERARRRVKQVRRPGVGGDGVVEGRADEDHRVAGGHGRAEEVALARVRCLKGVQQRPRRGVEDVRRAGVGLRRVVEGGADDGDRAGRGDGVAEEVVVGRCGVRERLDEGAGPRVEEVRRAGTGGAACVERRADDDRVARRGEREAEEVVEGGGGLGECAHRAALEEEDRTRVRGAAVEVRRADQEVGADRGNGGTELVARGGRRLEERGDEGARRRVE